MQDPAGAPPRRALALLAAASFALALGALAADAAWNVEDALFVEGAQAPLHRNAYNVDPESAPRIPHRAANLTLRVDNHRPLPHAAAVHVSVGGDYAHARVVLLDTRVDLGPWEAADLEFTLDPAVTGTHNYTAGRHGGGKAVSFIIERDDAKYYQHVIVDRDAE